MATATPPAPLLTASRAEDFYPILTPAQLSRMAARGRRRRVERGEVLFALGDVRSGNIKQVASGVGEGSIAIAAIHRVLAE